MSDNSRDDRPVAQRRSARKAASATGTGDDKACVTDQQSSYYESPVYTGESAPHSDLEQLDLKRKDRGDSDDEYKEKELDSKRPKSSAARKPIVVKRHERVEEQREDQADQMSDRPGPKDSAELSAEAIATHLADEIEKLSEMPSIPNLRERLMALKESVVASHMSSVFEQVLSDLVSTARPDVLSILSKTTSKMIKGEMSDVAFFRYNEALVMVLTKVVISQGDIISAGFASQDVSQSGTGAEEHREMLKKVYPELFMIAIEQFNILNTKYKALPADQKGKPLTPGQLSNDINIISMVNTSEVLNPKDINISHGMSFHRTILRLISDSRTIRQAVGATLLTHDSLAREEALMPLDPTNNLALSALYMIGESGPIEETHLIPYVYLNLTSLCMVYLADVNTSERMNGTTPPLFDDEFVKKVNNTGLARVLLNSIEKMLETSAGKTSMINRGQWFYYYMMRSNYSEERAQNLGDDSHMKNLRHGVRGSVCKETGAPFFDVSGCKLNAAIPEGWKAWKFLSEGDDGARFAEYISKMISDHEDAFKQADEEDEGDMKD